MGAYPQMPYEAISELKYHQLTSNIIRTGPKSPGISQLLLNPQELTAPDLRCVEGDATVDPEIERFCDWNPYILESTCPSSGILGEVNALEADTCPPNIMRF
ncbi:hypothetical protein K7432_012095 [Basidiobolus ranarum]|uniref:Uncharacterized protein n=1 Tax=Basidiobolus ranarum TaxID=34480 RepID=A0ABR2VST0_9FUNG